jgi:uncharacterized membrane protein AbrB (regulator of aidB expression)
MNFESIKARWRDLMARRTQLVEEYGMIAVLTLFGLSLPIYGVFFFLSWREGGLNGTASILTTAGMAWATTRATLPLRILGALVLTPFVAKLVRRRKQKAGTG